MSNEIIQYEEISNHFHNLKIVLENTLNIMSAVCYKDHHGDYSVITKIEEINEIKNALIILVNHIKKTQGEIKLV